MSELQHELDCALAAAEQACKVIRKGFEEGFLTHYKADDSIVTSIDQAAEEVIIHILQNETEHAILSEETGAINGHCDLTWVIDPLDGTSNFARRLSPFAVSIALMDGDESLLGVIKNPMTGECYHAVKGSGAFRNSKSIHVAGESSLNRSIIFFNYGYLEQDKKLISAVVERLIQDFGLRTWGATAWELCAVADGTADAFVCVGDKLWDFAAGMCIVKEAGGLFTDWHGEIWNSGHSFILAASPEIQSQLIAQIQSLQKL